MPGRVRLLSSSPLLAEAEKTQESACLLSPVRPLSHVYVRQECVDGPHAPREVAQDVHGDQTDVKEAPEGQVDRVIISCAAANHIIIISISSSNSSSCLLSSEGPACLVAINCLAACV